MRTATRSRPRPSRLQNRVLGLRRFFAAGARDDTRRAFIESRLEMMRGYAEHDHSEPVDNHYKTLSVELVVERDLLITSS